MGRAGTIGVAADMDQTRIRPDRKMLLEAAGRTISDVIAKNLRVLFCGINPGLYSAAVGQHFARPGNRFWPALHQSGFTDRQLTGFEDRELLQYGYGVTNLVARSTASADELASEEFVEGQKKLIRKIKRFQPQVVAVLGMGAYRAAFQQKKITLGCQTQRVGSTRIWVLPNPSGLNAHYQLKDLADQFRALKKELESQ